MAGAGRGRGWRVNIGSDTPDNHRSSMWNGYGTTKTPPSLTLFVANIPPGAWFERVEAVFLSDNGVTNVRQAKRGSMIFVDYENARLATEAMLKHQDHRFPGIDRGDGLKIDFDKDPDAKRNRAYAREERLREKRKAAMESLHSTLAPHQRVFLQPCCKCKDTVHLEADCPTEAECEKCHRKGHLTVHCCGRPKRAEKPPKNTEPVEEELPEGFASQMLAKMQNQAWGASSQAAPKRPKPAGGLIVVKAKKPKPSTQPVASSSQPEDTAEAREDTDDGCTTTAGAEAEPGKSQMSDDEDNGGGEVGGLLGLCNYGSDSDSET